MTRSRWAGPLARVRRTSEPAAPEGPRAVYARILDGETLWLAVRGAASVALDGRDLDLRPEGDLLTARIALTGPGSLTADGEPLAADASALGSGPLRTPPTRDGRWQYDVVEPDALRVTRTAREPEALLRAVSVDGDALVVALEGAETDALLLRDGDGPDAPEVGRFALTAGVARLPLERLPDRPLLVLTAGDRPVRRPRNALRFPGAAVVLPGLGAGDELSPYLRWLRDGRLALATADAERRGHA